MPHGKIIAREESKFRFELIRVAGIVRQDEQRRFALARKFRHRECGTGTDQAPPGRTPAGRRLPGNEKS
jgi:hypothetical protein